MNTQSRKTNPIKVSEVRLPTTKCERKTDKDESKVFPNTDDTEKLLSRVMYAGNSNSWQKGNIFSKALLVLHEHVTKSLN